jgi:hypothetical protein
MTPDEFRQLLIQNTADEIVEDIILADEPGPHTSREALDFLESKAKLAFGLNEDHALSATVVGSAKLGFAFLAKPGRGGVGYKPAYRAYEPGISDIDIAVVSPIMYGKIWQDLARFGANQQQFPWQTELAPYMLHGWIRPDKFPYGAPQRCNDWKNVVNEVGRSVHFRYKKLRCGIYQSRYFLKLYQQRGVLAAQQEENPA